MDSDAPGEITALIKKAAEGDSASAARLFETLYPRLRALAGRQIDRARAERTLQPTALVHEAWLRLADASAEWRDREHFLAVASQAMRFVLVDAARRRRSDRRGGSARRQELTDFVALFEERATDLVALDDALRKLAEHSEVQARIVELRFFGGMTMEEAARALEISRATAQRHWQLARAWLFRELEG